jgi:hypothetical protein
MYYTCKQNVQTGLTFSAPVGVLYSFRLLNVKLVDTYVQRHNTQLRSAPGSEVQTSKRRPQLSTHVITDTNGHGYIIPIKIANFCPYIAVYHLFTVFMMTGLHMAVSA